MAIFEKRERESAKDELANIVAGVPKGYTGTVPNKKEVLTTLIADKHRELTKLEIEEDYFRHTKGSGVKLAGVASDSKLREEQMGKLLQIATAKVRETKDYLEWLCEQWEALP